MVLLRVNNGVDIIVAAGPITHSSTMLVSRQLCCVELGSAGLGQVEWS